MPYEGEFARHRSIKRLVESKKVLSLLGDYETRLPESVINDAEDIRRPDIKPADWLPHHILAIDGSHVEVAIENGFPGAEASYLTVASVLLDVKKMRELDNHRPVNPKVFRELEKADSVDYALPGCNVVFSGDDSPAVSLRRKVFSLLRDHQASDEGETLLDSYEAILRYREDTDQTKCPYDDCQGIDQLYVRRNGEYQCPCRNRYILFSTDALRFHEGMNHIGTNGKMFAEIMQVVERLWVIHLLRMMEKREWLHLLNNVAFIMDGPLALFGHPAWLSQCIGAELYRLNALVRQATGKDILLVGVEKTGMFVQHLDMLDTTASGNLGAYPVQTVSLLTDQYIKRNIIFSQSDRPYGRQSYFGRKFFYKTRSGVKIVGTLPFLKDDDKDTSRAEPSQYPRLTDAMALLEQVASSRYPNSITPLISAHAEAAIPLNLGKKVLEQLAKSLMGERQP